MSALGQKQTSPHVRFMSALPPKADIAGRHLDVRFFGEGDVAVHSPMSDKLRLSGSCEIIQSLQLLPPAKYGEVSPNAFAVFLFRRNSIFVGSSTGRSAGLAPFRILSTKTAARRHIAGWSAP